MRNVDKIRTLENQNELLKKQIDELRAYQSKYDNLNKVYNALNLSNMAIMIAVTLECGEELTEIRDTGIYTKGWRLILPKIEVDKLLGKYEIYTTKTKDGNLINIVTKREEQHDEADVQGSEEAAGGGSKEAEADKVQEPGM